jgi:hypothetical protein
MRVSKRVFMAVCALVTAALTSWSSLSAATLSKVDDDVLAPLRAATIAKKIRLEKLPLYGSRPTPIDLEEFQVWAPEGKVAIHDGHGNTTLIAPPPMRFFRGQVNGDPESFAYFSIELATGKITGMVATKDDNFAIDAVPRRFHPQPKNRTIDQDSSDAGGYDYMLTSTNANDMNMPEGVSWQCAVEQHAMTPPTLRHTQTDAHGLPIESQAISGTQHYAIRLEVETDDELYTNSLSNVTTLTTYVINMTGAVSTIYNRDLKTDVFLVGIHTHTGGAGTDQWLQTNPNLALYEFGTYYHNNPGYQLGTHSSAVFLSGKNVGAGVAWEAVICNGDFFCGATGSLCGDSNAANKYGGSYAWCGLIGFGGFGSIPNPDTTTNGTLYGMPTGTQNYWPLTEYAHELGHNLAGHHTHCVAIADAERITAGFTDGSPATSASDFVDHCFATEGGACFAGSNYVAGSQSVFKGTIMSYCHNVFVSGVPQSRFTFGQAVEPSHHELDDYMLNASGPLTGGVNIVTTTSATMNTFTASATVTGNSTGNVASITTTNATTFSWSITNGTITSATNSTSITYTAGASGTVVLKATAYGSNGCGITDTKSVPIVSVTYNPPTNVEAHAISTTQALVSWVAPASGTVPGRYNVYRSANPDYTAFSFVGFGATTSFTDTVTNGKAYLYKVRSADAGNTAESADSNRDLATIVIYTNPTLTVGSSTIQAVDLLGLRAAVDAVRFLYGIGAGFNNFTVTAGTLIHAQDINDMRVNLNTAITGMGFPSPTYSHPGTITTGMLVTAADFSELRAAMR